MKVRCIFFLTINYQHRTLWEAHWQTATCCASPASLGLQHGWEETVGCPTRLAHSGEHISLGPRS